MKNGRKERPRRAAFLTDQNRARHQRCGPVQALIPDQIGRLTALMTERTFANWLRAGEGAGPKCFCRPRRRVAARTNVMPGIPDTRAGPKCSGLLDVLLGQTSQGVPVTVGRAARQSPPLIEGNVEVKRRRNCWLKKKEIFLILFQQVYLIIKPCGEMRRRSQNKRDFTCKILLPRNKMQN